MGLESFISSMIWGRGGDVCQQGILGYAARDVGGKKLKGEVWRRANTNKIKSGRKKKATV